MHHSPMTAPRQLRVDEPFSVPGLSDSVFQESNGINHMIWFIAAAIQEEAPRRLTVNEIFESIEKHQPWRISKCKGSGEDKRRAARRNIQWILSQSPAFARDDHACWYMTGAHLVRTSRPELPEQVVAQAETPPNSVLTLQVPAPSQDSLTSDVVDLSVGASYQVAPQASFVWSYCPCCECGVWSVSYGPLNPSQLVWVICQWCGTTYQWMIFS